MSLYHALCNTSKRRNDEMKIGEQLLYPRDQISWVLGGGGGFYDFDMVFVLFRMYNIIGHWKMSIQIKYQCCYVVYIQVPLLVWQSMVIRMIKDKVEQSILFLLLFLVSEFLFKVPDFDLKRLIIRGRFIKTTCRITNW